VKKFRWVLVCATLLVVVGRAQAQWGPSTELTRGWSLRAGFFVPEREAPRASEGDIWSTIGVERAFYEAEQWTGTISIDYYGSGRVYNVPITVNLRGENNRWRYGAGVGVGISHDLQEGILGVAYNFLLGYTLVEGRHPVTADFRYLGQTTGRGELNGWGFTLGTTF
jgi:hypothetical protein